MNPYDALRHAISRQVNHRGAVPVTPPKPTAHLQKSLAGREVACVVMAGGQATRLGASVPKGVMPFAPVTGKPLLQLIAERVAAYGARYAIPSRLAIMTSEGTDEPIRQLFERHRQFGVGSVDFFVQSSLPLLDIEENPALDSKGRPITGPDGNGGVFRRLVESGILEKWKEVEAICIITVDNPLIDPLCPAFLLPILDGADVTAGVVERSSPEEQVGLFVEEEGKTRVIEYTELDPSLRDQKDPSGQLLFRWANISAFGCSLPFVRKAAALPLPLHAAKKTVHGQKMWKGEYFVFDALSAAQAVTLVPLDRGESFAPIKDPDSFKAAQEAFQKRLPPQAE